MFWHCLIAQVETAKECAKQCADEAQCNGWSHFAPAKRWTMCNQSLKMCHNEQQIQKTCWRQIKKTTWQQIEKHLGNKYIYILSTNTDNNKLLPSPGVISSLLSRARWLSLQELSPVRNRAKRKWGVRENKELRMKENGVDHKTPKKTLMQKVMKYNSTKVVPNCYTTLRYTASA